MFHADMYVQGADVFNGQKSVLWNNLRDTFGKELRAMYQEVAQPELLSYDRVEKMFEDHQAKWPEAIFNEDAKYKYIDPLAEDGDATYLPMLQGSKAEQRKWWLYNRFRYINSKYNAGSALEDYIQLRGYAKADITITPYADIYPSIKFGSYLAQQKGQRGQTCTIQCPMDQMNDTEIYIYSASALASVGDLSPLKVGLADFSRAVKLQEVKVGAPSPYSNTNMHSLTFGNNTLLRKVDARNCSGLNTSVNMQNCTGLREALFEGTNITRLYLPDGGELTTLHLPGSITNLTIKNQHNITDFTCPDFSRITTLNLEDPADAIDTAAIVNAMPSGSRIRLTNFHWELQSLSNVISMFEKMENNMIGVDQNGNDTTYTHEAVQGTITVNVGTSVEQDYINNTLKFSSVRVHVLNLVPCIIYHDAEGTRTEAVQTGGSGTITMPRPKPQDVQYTYTPLGWSKTENGAVDSDALTSIIQDRDVYAVYLGTTRQYPVTFMKAAEDSQSGEPTQLGEILYFDYNTIPVYNGQQPTSSRTKWSFQGWSPELAAVTGPATYTAVFRAPVKLYYYDRDWANDSTQSVKLYEEDVVYGGSGSWSGTPVRDDTVAIDYTFAGWSNVDGGSGTVDANARTNLTETKTVYASYSQAARTYTITFKKASEDGGQILQGPTTMEYNAPVTYNGDTSVITSSRGTDFVFNGWTPTIGPVTGNQDYIAVFKDMSSPVISYLKGTMTDYESDTATKIAQYAFKNRLTLTEVETTATTIETYAFDSCSNLETVDFTNPTGIVNIAAYAFNSCSKLTAIIIRSSQVATLANANAFVTSIFISGDAAIYVPSNLLSDYKGAQNWSTFADRIYPITKPFVPVTNFDTIKDEWGTIISKINNGTANYAIGDSKTVDLGSEGKAKMIIVGVNKDELADDSGNTAKYTWWARIMPNTKRRMNEAGSSQGQGAIGGWKYSEMRTYLGDEGTIWNLLPSDLKSGIKAVKKYSTIYNTSGEMEKDVLTTDKLFLFSLREVNNNNSSYNTYMETQGPIYNEYFTANDNSKRIGYVNGSAYNWWLRSAYSASGFCIVSRDGSVSSNSASSSYGVGFGYCT